MAFYESQITDKIYHGCASRYSNGARKLIDFEKCERCLIPTSKSFWKETTDIRMQIRNSTKKDNLFLECLNILKFTRLVFQNTIKK